MAVLNLPKLLDPLFYDARLWLNGPMMIAVCSLFTPHIFSAHSPHLLSNSNFYDDLSFSLLIDIAITTQSILMCHDLILLPVVAELG